MSERISLATIDQHAEALGELALKIWGTPEMGWHEWNATKWTCEYLEKEGFEVELGAYGMPTAIRAVWGHGHPVIGFCAEYDCLPGLSQKAFTPTKDPVVPGGNGHGCGHNLLGVGCLGACIGLKAELEATGKEGTIIYYGCPAEEQMIGKGLMAKNGAFTECDFTIAWHPGASNQNKLGTMVGVEGAYFHFKGRTAHAAGGPQLGRSALDAAQLMNMGVEFLREHLTMDVRIHYIFTEAGLAPNIVPDSACVKYFVRALTRESVMDAFNRVVKCAEGAAHMTETTVEIERMGGLYPTLPNTVLTKVMQEAREEIPAIEWTEEELKFADELNRTSPQYVEGTAPFNDAIVPLNYDNGYGSTDYGDVMHIRPGVMNSDCCYANLATGHSWMVTACTGSSVGVKGMIRAAKVMALGAMKVIEDPSILEAATAEFEAATAGRPYVCPITDEIPWPYEEK